MDYLFDVYENIQLFATSTQYRGYKLLDEQYYSKEDFITQMQMKGFVQHKFSNPINPDINVDIYLFSPNSKYIDDTNEFKKLLGRYTTKHEIIMITEDNLDVYRKKQISLHKDLFIKNYLHSNFYIELNRGPLCSIHSILTDSEAEILKKEICASLDSIGAISVMDPQNIWLNGKIGDILKIKAPSEISGYSIRYRIVVPDSDQVDDTQDNKIVKKVIKKVVEKDKNVDAKKVTFEEDSDAASNNEDYADNYDDVESDDN